MKSRFLAFALVVCMVFTLCIPISHAQTPFSKPFTSSTVTPSDISLSGYTVATLFDMTAGSTLYAFKNNLDIAFPAMDGIVMLMTAYITSTSLSHDTDITCGNEVSSIDDPSSIGLQEGNKLSARDLLAAVLLENAKDAVLALANFISPSTDEFVSLMNQTAKNLGMSNTLYVDPCGEYYPTAATTTRDLLTLTSALYAQPIVQDILSEPAYRIETADGSFTKTVKSHLSIIGKDDRVNGLAQSSSSEGGMVTILSAKHADRVLLLVLISENRSINYDSLASALFSFGYSAYALVDFTDVAEALLTNMTLTLSNILVSSFRLPDNNTASMNAAVETALASGIKNNISAFSVTPSSPIYNSDGTVVATVTFKYLNNVIATFKATAEAPEALKKLNATPTPISTHTGYEDLPTSPVTASTQKTPGLRSFIWVIYIILAILISAAIIALANLIKKRMQ